MERRISPATPGRTFRQRQRLAKELGVAPKSLIAAGSPRLASPQAFLYRQFCKQSALPATLASRIQSLAARREGPWRHVQSIALQASRDVRQKRRGGFRRSRATARLNLSVFRSCKCSNCADERLYLSGRIKSAALSEAVASLFF
jgi:hypothetical protein